MCKRQTERERQSLTRTDRQTFVRTDKQTIILWNFSLLVKTMYLCFVLSSLILAPPLPLPCPSPSVYLGHHTYLINPYDLETNPALWMSTVSQYKGRRGGAGPEEIWPLTMCMPCT